MNDVLKREISHAYIPQDVQVAIDTILSYAYTINLENQVLRRRLEDAKRLLDDREIDKEIVATHMNTEASESIRIRKIANETLPATEKEKQMEASNIAELRETVKELLDAMYDMGIDEETVSIAAKSPNCHMHSAKLLSVIKKAKAALAKPPRNCDVGTPSEKEDI